jgi:hypothetical protein
MTISFLGNFAVDYSSENHHANSIESLGHKVIKLQEGRATADEVFERSIRSDVLVWVHTHGWETPGNIEEAITKLKISGVKIISYHLDLWFGIERHKDLEDDPFYKQLDYFFATDKKMTDWFSDNTDVQGVYLQAGVYEPECYMDGSGGLQNDVIFIGSKGYHHEWPYRPQLINWLAGTYGDRFKHFGGDGLGTVRGAALNQLYGSTKIVVGDTLCMGFDYPSYWSDRVYETLGRGGFLIHPYIKGMEEHFTDKEHLVFYEYGNFEQLRYLIEYYTYNVEEREKIRLAGHAHVKKNHTYKNRWETILSTVKGVKS